MWLAKENKVNGGGFGTRNGEFFERKSFGYDVGMLFL